MFAAFAGHAAIIKEAACSLSVACFLLQGRERHTGDVGVWCAVANAFDREPFVEGSTAQEATDTEGKHFSWNVF